MSNNDIDLKEIFGEDFKPRKVVDEKPTDIAIGKPFHEYMEILEDNTDIPEHFRHVAKWNLISNCCGQFFEYVGTRDRYPYPMEYFLLQAPIKVGRKSTLIWANQDLYLDIFSKYLTETHQDNIKKNGLNIREHLKNGCLYKGTAPGIVDSVQEYIEKSRKYGLPLRTIPFFNPEAGFILNEAFNNRSVEHGFSEILSLGYYGEGFTWSLSKRSGYGARVFPSGLSMNVLFGIQRFKQIGGFDTLRQGLFRRFNTMSYEATDKKTDYISVNFRQMWDDINERYIVDRAKNLMIQYRELADKSILNHKIQAMPDMRVIEDINKINQDREDKLKNEQDNIIHMATCAINEHLLKCTVLEAIGNNKELYYDEKIGYPALKFCWDDYKIVKKILFKAEELNIDHFLDMGSRSEPIRTDENDLEFVWNWIHKLQSRPEGQKRGLWAINTDLLRYCKKLEPKLLQIISTLVKQHRVIAETFEGRKGQYYRAVEPEEWEVYNEEKKKKSQ